MLLRGVSSGTGVVLIDDRTLPDISFVYVHADYDINPVALQIDASMIKCTWNALTIINR